MQLLAFSLHKSGSNLPEVNPLRPWRPVDDAAHLDVIYDWDPDEFGALSRELERADALSLAHVEPTAAGPGSGEGASANWNRELSKAFLLRLGA